MRFAIIIALTTILLAAAEAAIWILIAGLLNLVFRKPFFNRWKDSLGTGIIAAVCEILSYLLFKRYSVATLTPYAVGGCLLLLVVFIWVCSKPNMTLETESAATEEKTL